MRPSAAKGDIAARMRVTLDLFAAGEALMRQNLRRQHPEETEDMIDRRLADWRLTRPGAEAGDGEQPRPPGSPA